MLLVADIMTSRLITLKPTDTLKRAREIMHVERIRHIPIVSQSKFIGLFSQRDLLKASVSFFADLDNTMRDQIEDGVPIAEAMATVVVTVPPEMPLIEAANILLEHKYGCLPVLKDGQLCGILTEADFVKTTVRLLDGTLSV